ncbi:hypothetical protein L6164_037551 [Bauhinia variegata]|uniref:Uncharacterized protein n=1 Tax=Bauhinia variegata TaxID=167791 RepID=A0ACB9KKE9_BAUVA|nr:hypothetical protein L6164_037551 [Bauhinia variegata]
MAINFFIKEEQGGPTSKLIVAEVAQSSTTQHECPCNCFLILYLFWSTAQLGVYIFNLIGIQRIYESKLNHKLCGKLLRLTFDEITTLNMES